MPGWTAPGTLRTSRDIREETVVAAAPEQILVPRTPMDHDTALA
jgi:hypothetical protein